MEGQWTKERVWEWYNARPWIRGCNFMGSDVINWLDMWQAYEFDKKLQTADRELELLVQTGYNAIRTLLFYPIWKEDHDGFMERLEQVIFYIYLFLVENREKAFNVDRLRNCDLKDE